MSEVFFISLAMGSAHFSLFYGGMSLAENVSAVAVATQLGVPFATIMSIVFLGEQVGWRRWTGISMAFVGVMVISFDPAIISERLGLILVVGAAFIGSLGTIVMKRITDTGVYQMQAWIAMLSWPPLIAVSLIFEAATARVIMSLKPKIPTSLPFSTTSAAFLESAMRPAVSRKLVCGDTIVDGLPASRLRNVGDVLFPKA